MKIAHPYLVAMATMNAEMGASIDAALATRHVGGIPPRVPVVVEDPLDIDTSMRGLDDTVFYGQVGPRMPWEVKP